MIHVHVYANVPVPEGSDGLLFERDVEQTGIYDLSTPDEPDTSAYEQYSFDIYPQPPDTPLTIEVRIPIHHSDETYDERHARMWWNDVARHLSVAWHDHNVIWNLCSGQAEERQKRYRQFLIWVWSDITTDMGDSWQNVMTEDAVNAYIHAANMFATGGPIS